MPCQCLVLKLHHKKCPNLIGPWLVLTDEHLYLPQIARANLPGRSDLSQSRSDFCDWALVRILPFLGQPLQEQPCEVNLVMQGGCCQRWYIWMDSVTTGQPCHWILNSDILQNKHLFNMYWIQYKYESELPANSPCNKPRCGSEPCLYHLYTTSGCSRFPSTNSAVPRAQQDQDLELRWSVYVGFHRWGPSSPSIHLFPIKDDQHRMREQALACLFRW